MKEGKIIGHIVLTEGVKIDPIRVEVIKNISIPRSKKEIQSVLGKIKCLRIFISNFVELVKFIIDMLRKGNEVEWTLEAMSSFEQISKQWLMLLF